MVHTVLQTLNRRRGADTLTVFENNSNHKPQSKAFLHHCSAMTSVGPAWHATDMMTSNGHDKLVLQTCWEGTPQKSAVCVPPMRLHCILLLLSFAVLIGAFTCPPDGPEGYYCVLNERTTDYFECSYNGFRPCPLGLYCTYSGTKWCSRNSTSFDLVLNCNLQYG